MKRPQMRITDSEIAWTEHLLLPARCHLDDERRAFIRCMESRDVVACPGSGKTTTLLAKLLILSNRMPFQDGRGVCVLTHTNVGIDQIKSRAGAAAQALFRHPNFFGTIQEFTNRFLAIPAYVAKFGQRHIRMDEDLYEEQVARLFRRVDLQKDSLIYVQLKKRLEGLTWQEQLPLKIDFFRSLQFKLDGGLVHYIRGDTGKTILRGDGKSKSYDKIHKAKYGLLAEGYLRYHDAFPLALWYVQHNPMLSKAFQHRFAFVFVDEAQDTSTDQFAVLHAAFGDTGQTIVQYLGDPNQAIYSFSVKKELDWTPRPKPLHFSGTVRYGPTIAKLLTTVRIDDRISLKPNPTRESLPPHLLTFGEGEERRVLPAFAQLLRNHYLDILDGEGPLVFKAIGWVGKDREDKGKLCLRSYFAEYRKAIQGRRQHFTNLLSYLHHQPLDLVASVGARLYRDSMLRGITQALTVAGKLHPETGRAFTPTTFLAWLREHDEVKYQRLLSRISRWSLKLVRGEISRSELRDGMAAHLRDKWCDPPMPDVEAFLMGDELEFSDAEQKACNIFRDGSIQIEVGTVHSVKGETHTATLYLETDYQKATDSIRLLPFLKGEYPEMERGKTYHIENLKVAHVAMSRPTHLLCFACREASIMGQESTLETNGWRICGVADTVE